MAADPRIIVLDPGHGGAAVAGRSTPDGIVAPDGTREKELTLALARRAATELRARGYDVRLTRDADVNPRLAARAAVADAAGAALFVSLHFRHAAFPRSETWLHPDAASTSRALAWAIQRALLAATALADGGVHVGELAVLAPQSQRAACLVELDVRADGDAAARGLADGIDRFLGGAVAVERRARFDLWHEVPLVPQLTGMSCWAAAAAMLIGWNECIVVDPEEVARGSGRWEDYRDGLRTDDIGTLARAFGFAVETVPSLTPAVLRALLEECGPLWVGEGSSGLHVVVVTGAFGDGTPAGTRARVADPWPVAHGSRYTLSLADLAADVEAAAALAGAPIRILHLGHGAARSRARPSYRASEFYASFRGTRPG